MDPPWSGKAKTGEVFSKPDYRAHSFLSRRPATYNLPNSRPLPTASSSSGTTNSSEGICRKRLLASLNVADRAAIPPSPSIDRHGRGPGQDGQALCQSLPAGPAIRLNQDQAERRQKAHLMKPLKSRCFRRACVNQAVLVRVPTGELGFGCEIRRFWVNTRPREFESKSWRFSRENSRYSRYNATL